MSSTSKLDFFLYQKSALCTFSPSLSENIFHYSFITLLTLSQNQLFFASFAKIETVSLFKAALYFPIYPPAARLNHSGRCGLYRVIAVRFSYQAYLRFREMP